MREEIELEVVGVAKVDRVDVRPILPVDGGDRTEQVLLENADSVLRIPCSVRPAVMIRAPRRSLQTTFVSFARVTRERPWSKSE